MHKQSSAYFTGFQPNNINDQIRSESILDQDQRVTQSVSQRTADDGFYSKSEEKEGGIEESG